MINFVTPIQTTDVKRKRLLRYQRLNEMGFQTLANREKGKLLPKSMRKTDAEDGRIEEEEAKTLTRDRDRMEREPREYRKEINEGYSGRYARKPITLADYSDIQRTGFEMAQTEKGWPRRYWPPEEDKKYFRGRKKTDKDFIL